MQLGMVGLGRMGANMTERLRAAGHDVKTFDPNVDSRSAGSLEELVQQLDAPRSVWLMVPVFWRKATWLPCGALGLPEVKPLPLPATPAPPA